MKNKKIGIIIAIIAIISFLLSYIITYAANTETIYVNLTKTDLNGIGYGIGDPTNSGAGNYIWNLQLYNSNDVSDISTQQRNLYCIKANYGDTWNANNSDIVAYNLSYSKLKISSNESPLVIPFDVTNLPSLSYTSTLNPLLVV